MRAVHSLSPRAAVVTRIGEFPLSLRLLRARVGFYSSNTVARRKQAGSKRGKQAATIQRTAIVRERSV